MKKSINSLQEFNYWDNKNKKPKLIIKLVFQLIINS